MSIWTYLGIALITMEADATACFLSGIRYRWFASLSMSLLWPITSPSVILGVIKMQRRKTNKKEPT